MTFRDSRSTRPTWCIVNFDQRNRAYGLRLILLRCAAPEKRPPLAKGRRGGIAAVAQLSRRTEKVVRGAHSHPTWLPLCKVGSARDKTGIHSITRQGQTCTAPASPSTPMVLIAARLAGAITAMPPVRSSHRAAASACTNARRHPAGRPVHGRPDHARRFVGCRPRDRGWDRRSVQPGSEQPVQDRIRARRTLPCRIPD